ncbi:n-acylethanolamine-hydrolyzing acid amidase-like [Stylonychia lemnae]|uniref:N-acylethanolamine-hydrolyzing acid amidase-like n=1 Tax=Stylonychia lemnae TaxID=5949 RepID=A0A078AFW7_STYLE|nr:n-acylethanolamine-hydrolyzing acid amidase-like [Stylonychia lemnae]|eukprot:CDW81180.1 n-acylethanolamine-hydrolyzing acid amidase-like [Stylonychia lemnae]
METLFIHSIAQTKQDFFKDNIDQFSEVNPHAYYAMETLAQKIGLETYQTFFVNSIVDFSSFCTSIVARMQNGTIIHARNLDFDFPDVLNRLVYLALYKVDGKIAAEAPSIAGYIGSYTGLRYDSFTVSYNVRFIRNLSNIEINMEKELAGVIPTAQLIQETLIQEGINFKQAVQKLSNTEINTPCYIIVGGIQKNDGIVITREREGVNHTNQLSDEQWYVAQTNMDYWLNKDVRYEQTKEGLDKVGQEAINLDNIVKQVLWQDGVLQSITIFSASLSAALNKNDIYLIKNENRYNLYSE